MACGVDDARLCKKRFEELIAYRASAIHGAFGDPFTLPDKIAVEFFYADDPKYGHLHHQIAYDPERRAILVSRFLMRSHVPNPLRSAQYYWPFYENTAARTAYRVIPLIDNALWTAFLQEAAKARGLRWPHAACSSTNVSQRLPCEMVTAGIVEHLTTLRLPIFNENRIDVIWPDDFGRFSSAVWQQDDEYQDVKRYGGILLMRPLIAQFGLLQTMACAAQTPFEVHEPSLRTAALRYQREARQALASRTQLGEQSVASLFGKH
jgi:hypothetical protein